MELKQVLKPARAFLSLMAFVIDMPFAYATQGPSQFSLSGGLYNANGTPVTSNSVDFRIEILDPSGTCVLYSEVHNNEDLSDTKGGFALQVGTGVSGVNNVAGGSALTTSVFENNGVTAVAGCAAQTFNSGDNRVIRVSYDLGSGFVAMNPDIPMTAAAYSMVAESVQGKRASDLVQIRNDNSTYYLGQSNIEWVFNSTNWTRLQALLNGNSSQYMVTNPGADVSFNNRKIINVATPTANTDATNKQYVDGNIAGYGASLSGIGLGAGGGSTLVWDQVDNRWEIGTPIATDNTKLPLAGGTMTGGITMGGFDLYNVGNITMADQRVLRLGSYTSAQEGLLALGTANAGTMFYNSTTGQLRVWNGTDYSGISPTGAAGGDLTGSYPNPSIANNAVTSAKIADGTIATADIGNSQITSAKINNTGIAVNRILMTDATTGGTVGYASCAQDEILKFNSSTGWGCSTAASLIGNTTVTAGAYGSATSVGTFTVDAQGRLTAAANTAIAFPVTSVAGKTGVITLNTGDINGLGTAATYNVGTGAGQIPALDGSSRFPAVDGGLLTNINAQRLQSRTISSAAPTDGQVLRWNNTLAQWEPSTPASAPVSSVNGKTGVVTIELADIAGAGDMTEVNTGNGLLGGATSGVANLSVNAGTGANQIVQLNANSFLPAVDGNLLTNLNAVRLQGRVVSSTAPADLQVLQWNATTSQWNPVAIPSAPVASVNGKTGVVTIELADIAGAGDITAVNSGTGLLGGVTSGVADLSVNVGTGANQIVQLTSNSFLPAVDGNLLTNLNAVRLQGRVVSSTAPADLQVLQWNATTSQWNPVAIPSAPVASVNGKTGVVTIELSDIAGAGDMTEVNTGNGLLGGATSGVANLSVNAGTGANQIVQIGSDGVLPVIDGNKLTNLNALRIQGRPVSSTAPADLQVLQWNATTSQWNPVAIPSAPVASVNGKTGVVTIELADIAGAGDITQVVAGTGATGGGMAGVVTVGVNVGTGANQILQLDSNSFVPAVDGNLLTNLNAVRLQGRAVSSTAPADLQVLQWNATTSQWNPVAIPSAPVASVNGKTGVVTIELADIAGAGDMTEVNTGNGLLGGATSGVANLSVNAGTGANQIVQIGSDGVLPVIDGNKLTNLNALRIQGRPVSSTAPADLQVLQWNATLSQWSPAAIPSAPVASVNGKTGVVTIELADIAGAGDITAVNSGTGLLGGVTSGVADLSVNVGTGANQIVQLTSNSFLPAVDGNLLTNLNAVRIQGRAVSSTAPADLQVLQWNATTSQWNPVAIPSAPVASVNGKTGVVTIELADIAGAGDMTEVNTGNGLLGGATSGVANLSVNAGTGANQIVQLGADARIPALDGSLVTNLNAVRLQGRAVSSTAPADLQVLQWNATLAQWSPVAIPSAPVASVNGKTGVVTIELADIAGAGDITEVNSGTGLLGGATSGVVNLSINVGTGANQIVQVGSDGVLPAIDGNKLTNLNALRIQGRAVSSTAPADLQVLQWNATLSQWSPVAIPSAPVASVNGKTGVVTIELADIAGAGDMTEVNTGNGLLGGATSGIANLSVNAGTGANQIVQLNANSFLPAVDGNLLTNLNAVRIQGRAVSSTAPTADQVLRWNNTTAVWEPQTLAAAGITALTGDVVASGSGSVASTISNNAISSAKINNSGIAVNRLLITDATTGATVTYASCAQDEIMKFNSSTGWGCAVDAGSGASVSLVATGNGLLGGPISSSGTISVNTGTGANQIVQLNANSFLPAVDGNLLTNLNAVRLQGRVVSSTAPNNLEVLQWNSTTAQWAPVAIPSAPVASVNGKTGVVTIELADIAGAGDMTEVNTGNGLLGGATSGVANLSVNTGTGANQIVQLNANSFLPAVDGNLLTNLNAVRLQGRTLASTAPTDQQVIMWNNTTTTWEPGSIPGATFPMLSTSNGSAAAPAYSFNGDADNGMYKPSTNYLAFSTFGTQRMTIDGSGNVGFGSATPGYRVHVGAGGDASGNSGSWTPSLYITEAGNTGLAVRDSTNNVEAYIYSASTGATVGTLTNHSLTLKTNDQNRLTVTNAGAVGIMTTSPTAGTVLDLAGAGTAQSSVIVPRDTTANRPTGVNGMIRFNTTTQKFEAFEGVWQNMISSGGASNAFVQDGNSFTGIATIGTNDAYRFDFETNATTRMSIDSSGKVGIGTTTPYSQLVVINSANGGSTIAAATPGTQANQQASFNMITKDNAVVLGNAGTKGWMFVARGDAYTNAAQQNDFGISYYNGTSWVDPLWIDSATSNVGIGTTTPGVPLDVVGNIRASGRIVGGAAADADALSALTVDFSSANVIRATAASADCGTLNVTNTTAGGSFTVTIVNATKSCTAIQWNGAPTNVKLPTGYVGGATVNGIVYTFLDDGSMLWVSTVGF